MRALAPPARPAPARRASVQPSTDGATSAVLTKKGNVDRGSDAQFLQSYNDWQGWARRYSRSIGAASFNALVISDMCARCDLTVENRKRGSWEPVDNDPRFDGITDEYSNSLLGPDDLIRIQAWHYQVAGEMLGTVHDGDFGTEYGIYSVAAAEWDKPDEGMVTIKLVPDGKVEKGSAFVVPRNQVVRFWMPDQEWQAYAWSPMAAAITDLKRYDALARYALKTADSAVAMSGLLWGPGEAHVDPPSGDFDDADPEDAGTPRSRLEQLYYEIARVRTSASEDVMSVVPPFLHWDKDLGEPKYVKLGEPLDPNGIAYREEALADFARATPLPVGTIVGGGMGDGNHWSEWLASRKMFDSGVAPTMDRITHLDVTRSFLWPRMLLAGVDKAELRNWRIGYDAAPVIVQPDNSNNALSAWSAGLLDDGPALEAMGFDPNNDLLTDPSKKAWLLEVLSRGHAGSTYAPLVDSPANGVNTNGADVTQGPPSTEGTPVTAAAASRRPFVETTSFAPGAARAIRRLTELRRGTMTRLLAEAEHVYEDALRQAGAKFNTRARSRASKSKQAEVAAAVASGEPLRAFMGAVGLKEEELLRGVLDTFRRRALTELHNYRDAVVATVSAMAPDDRPAFDIVSKPEHAIDYLVAGLTAMVRSRLLDGTQATLAAAAPKAVPSRTPAPTGGDVLPGLPDPDELARAAARLVRNALDINEGRADFTLPPVPDLVPTLTVDRSQPPVEQALAESVGVTPLWVWAHGFYGEALTNLDAHDALDGFPTYERSTPEDPGDPELANQESWPGYDWYFPDDHDGCTCEWIIEVEDAQLTDADLELIAADEELVAEPDILRPNRIQSTEEVRDRAMERMSTHEEVRADFAAEDQARADMEALRESYRAEEAATEFPVEPWQQVPRGPNYREQVEAGRKEVITNTVDRLTGVQSAAANAYGEDMYEPMNEYLRFGAVPDFAGFDGEFYAEEYGIRGEADFKRFISELSSAINKGVTKQDVTAFRFLDDQAGSLNLVPGAEVTDKGFVSTALHEDATRGFGNIEMQIRVPAGTPALWFNPSESEMLLPPGTKMRVIERIGSVVKLEVIP